MRIGFVGAGAVARRHGDVLAGLGQVEIVGVTDVTPGQAESFGVPVFETLAAMLAGAALDAAYVCVPPFAHGEPERALIAAGLPFFVEKPLAADLETAEALGAAVEAAGLLTATGYHWRNLDVVEQARRLLAETPARMAVGAWMDKVPPPAWWLRRELSGGQTIEQSTHVLDLMLDLLGDVEEVHAVSSRSARAAFPEADVDDVVAGTLRFASGAVGSLASTSLLASKHRAGLELFCEGRRLELSEIALVIDEGDGAPRRIEDPGEAKRRVDRDFVDAVQGGENRVRAPYAVALRTHRVACALTRSAADGAAVDLRDPV